MTCSVPAIPWAWYEQLVDGGSVLVDLKIGLHAGNLVLLHRCGLGLEGRFLPKWAGFMSARATDTAPARAPQERSPTLHDSRTTIDPDPWSAMVPWFLAQVGQPEVTGLTRTGTGGCTTRFSAADRSWCEIDAADEAGLRSVREGGPRRMWEIVEAAHRRWQGWGGPARDRFGITVHAGGRHELWLDTAGNSISTVIDGSMRDRS